MKRAILIAINIMMTGLINNIQSQEIRGQLISKYQDSFEPLTGMSVIIDTTCMISDIDGFFTFNTVKSNSNSIIISGYMYPKLKIINLTKDYKTLDLGKIELIEHFVVSPTQYDSIRTSLIKTFKTNELLINQQQKADSKLKSKYIPIQDWNNILGYVVLDSLTKYTMQNPFDKSIKIKVDYDTNRDMITLDYNKIKK